MILIVDNYDSFTYNLVQRLGEIDASLDIRVVRNDKTTPDEIAELRPERMIISPGPCTPNEAGISVECVRAFAGRLPLLGVCLGHQSIGQAFGAKIVRAPRLMHGKTDMISHDNQSLLAGLENPSRYRRPSRSVIDFTFANNLPNQASGGKSHANRRRSSDAGVRTARAVAIRACAGGRIVGARAQRGCGERHQFAAARPCDDGWIRRRFERQRRT